MTGGHGEAGTHGGVGVDLEKVRALAAERDRLRAALVEAEATLACVAVDLHDNGAHPDDAAEELATACQKAR